MKCLNDRKTSFFFSDFCVFFSLFELCDLKINYFHVIIYYIFLSNTEFVRKYFVIFVFVFYVFVFEFFIKTIVKTII